ncbi:MAG: substrate-binding domain-containing protein, partial [Caldilinea sp.]
MKRVQFVAILMLLTALVAGCVAPAAAPAAAPAEEAPAEAAPAEAAAGDQVFTTVVKIAGINWFNRMEEGVKKFAADTGINATLVGPAEADAAQQIPIIEDLIAQGVDALCVIPMDPTQLDPV